MTAPKLPLSALKGIGPARGKALGQAGVYTIYDLLMMLPVRYKDTLNVTPVEALRPGQTACVQGWIEAAPKLARFHGRTMVTARLRDDTGRIQDPPLDHLVDESPGVGGTVVRVILRLVRE